MSDPTARPPADTTTEARIAAAFGALATTEVPASAPRPAQGPRPPVRDDRSRRRRFGLATGGLLVAAAAVAVAVLVGGEVNDARVAPTAPPGTGGTVTTAPATSAPSTPAPTSPSPTLSTPGASVSDTPAGPSAAQVEQAFVDVSLPTRSQVVAVGTRYQAADLTNGTIRFWIWDGSAWGIADTSTYPPDAMFSGDTSYTAVISAAGLLTGMDVATFVVTGDLFTGDSTGTAIAYTAGPTGWGVVKAGDDGRLHPSGEGFPALGTTNAANLGLSYDESLVDGMLRTVDCSTTSPTLGGCGSAQYQVVKYWAWDGTQFVLDHREGPAS